MDTRAFSLFIAIALLSLIIGPSRLAGYTKSGTTYTTDGSLADVTAAVANASDADIVSIPAGTFTWGDNGSYLLINKGIVLIGAGEGSTIIQLSSTASTFVGTIRISAAAVVRDFTVLTPTTGNYASAFSTSGIGYGGWRITHITYDGYQGGAGRSEYFAYVGGNYGLIDNCTIIGGGGANELIFSRGPNDSWTTANSVGTQNALYIEDNTFSNLGYVTDINGNGRAVVRFNTITGTGVHVDCHMIDTATGIDGVHHGARQMEVYGNRWTAAAGPWIAIELTSGTGMVFDNSSDHIASADEPRFSFYNFGSSTASTYWTNLYPTTPYRTPTSYPVPDQIGTGTYPQAGAQEPYYIWNNTLGTADTGGPYDWPIAAKLIPAAAITQYQAETSNPLATFTMNDIVRSDRDYFKGNYGGTFTGASGVGRGTKAQMLAITPTKAGVGYWVTDEGEWNSLHAGTDGQLYVWNGTNWVLKYIPFEYPHPLRKPRAPSNLQLSSAP